MHLLAVICLLSLLNHSCVSDKHSYGEHIEYYSHRTYERTLIDDNNDVPKNYTIIYKYIGSYFKPVASIEIDVNVKSTGYIHHKVESFELSHKFLGSRTRDVFDSQVQINNALNVKAILTIYGQGMMSLPSMRYMGKDQATKSLTFIYVTDAHPSENGKQFAQNSIGKRRSGDKLIHFESRKIQNMNRFPSQSFEYSGDEYITYVGFSFSSPTAVALVNTSFVGEQEFNAVVYDINTENFVANMSVYGMSITRPRGFEGVI